MHLQCRLYTVPTIRMSFLYIVEDFAPSGEEIRDRENIRWELEQFIQELYSSRCLSHYDDHVIVYYHKYIYMYSLVGRKKQFTDLQMRKFKYIKMMHFHMELSFMNYLSRLAFHDIGCTGINMNCIAVRCFFQLPDLRCLDPPTMALVFDTVTLTCA